MDADTEIFEMVIEDPGDTTCTICYAEFLDIEDLIIHISQMHGPSLVQCQFCDKKCTDLDNYATHILEFHLVSLKSCNYCTRMFLNSDKQRKHESKHYTNVPKGKYTCSQCKALFSNIPELEYHEVSKHRKIGEGVLLQDVFPYLSALLNINALKFIQSLGTDTVYICVWCELTTGNVMKYIEHLKKRNCQSFVCHKCSFVYKRKVGLIKHFQGHKDCHSSNNKIFNQKCRECGKEFTLSTLKQHQKHCKPIKCRVCNWVFDTMYELTSHQMQFHPLSVSLQTCKFCKKEFVGTISLDKHIERAHKNQCHLYKYNCVYCMSIFNHPKKLFCHFYTKHKELEPYTCKICDLKFRLRKKFTLHIKLDHKSVGFVEFEENFHVFFTDKKSEKPFMPAFNKSNGGQIENAEDNTTDCENEQPNADEITDCENEQLNADEITDCENEQRNADNTMDCENEQRNPDEILEYGNKPLSVNKQNKKVSFQQNVNDTVNLDNACSDFMDVTETEGNHTDTEKPENRITRKRKLKNTVGNTQKFRKRAANNEIVISDTSDDEPLLEVKKRVKRKKLQKLRFATWNKKKHTLKNTEYRHFTCNICNKYCYTYQNFHNHVSLHSIKDKKRCVKCSKVFTSKDKLNKHIEREHSSSKLTETLKKLLYKRKNGVTVEELQLTAAEKFRRTIKKVKMDNVDSVAVLKPVVNDNLSVQKFIESFTPEVNEVPNKNIVVKSEISVKPVKARFSKPPLIKLTKFEAQPQMKNFGPKLAMPVKFKPDLGEKQKVSVKIVQDTSSYVDHNTETYFDDEEFKGEIEHYSTEIPEVAQEVMLEVSEEPKPMHMPHKIVIPNLPHLSEQCKEISIAHLLPEAPYYKIVKVKDLLSEQTKSAEPVKEKQKEEIKLPDGTKLVNVNPLAHLLGDTSVEKVLEKTKSKYYQAKSRDFETAIAKAMLKLDKPVVVSKKRGRKNIPLSN
ncbi:uncharacterized protein ACR2FA_010993 [Aphomia sociella]